MQAADLNKIPFLSVVPESELEAWAPLATVSTAQPRETLAVPGDPIDTLCLLARGLVMLCLQSRNGETRMKFGVGAVKLSNSANTPNFSWGVSGSFACRVNSPVAWLKNVSVSVSPALPPNG